jgi:AcrR family transcriptional regulator
VLDAAREMFTERGVDAVTIEEIATRAMVSPATVYNYFVSKNDLLIAMLEHEWSGAEARLATLGPRPGDDPATAMTRLVAAYNRLDEEFGPPDLWRQLLAASFVASPAVRVSYQQISDRFAVLLGRHLQDLADAGRLDPDADIDSLARALSAIADAEFHRRVRTCDTWPGSDARDLRRQIGILLRADR